METKTTIKGHTVSHGLDVSGGLKYLMYELDFQEAKVFFNEAHDHGSVIFEDHLDRKYKLIYHGGEYQLIRA
ncbi:MAG: hypothetical protein NTW11_02310 [Candidatus Staskawiczbacteria bacterium]|nr:hypothetical protein [Candidatus Staskawiczbacteria bacterium]